MAQDREVQWGTGQAGEGFNSLEMCSREGGKRAVYSSSEATQAARPPLQLSILSSVNVM